VAQVGLTYYVQGAAIDPVVWTNISTNTANAANMSVASAATPFDSLPCARRRQPTRLRLYQCGQLSQPILLPDGALQLQWGAVLGQRYDVQFTTNLIPAVWTTLTNITATADSMAFRQSGPLTNSVTGFYRIVKP
jgi:hypothetical protein